MDKIIFIFSTRLTNKKLTKRVICTKKTVPDGRVRSRSKKILGSDVIAYARSIEDWYNSDKTR